MTKIFITKKPIMSPLGVVQVGTKSLFDGTFYIFPYIGGAKTERDGWLGSAFMCSDPEQFPEWFTDWIEVTLIKEVPPLFSNAANTYQFTSSLPIDIDKYSLEIKTRIEELLNRNKTR